MGKVQGIIATEDKMQIYGLTDPRDDALRYVGKTEKLLKKRLGVHCASKEKNHRGNWIRSLVKEGFTEKQAMMIVSKMAIGTQK